MENPYLPLHKPLKEHHIYATLQASKSGSVAELDGILYEVWKCLDQQHKNEQKEDILSFDVIKTPTMIIKDIQIHGLDEQTNFTLGWMCPIYKKRISQRLRRSTPLIHPDQSGFVPKRLILIQYD